MTTTLQSAPPMRSDRPAYRPYRAQVESIVRLSPHFTRVTFFAEEFSIFGTDRLDQRVKLVFPLPGHGLPDVGADDPECIERGNWYERWRGLPDASRSPFRTYTVRTIDQDARLVAIDFVVHDDATDATNPADFPAHAIASGPAAAWLRGAMVGDEVVVVGPDARSIHSGIGIDWHPGSATQLLLAGDETAAPAICAILESLSSECTGHVFIEIPTEADQLPVTAPIGVTVTWLSRGHDRVGELLIPALAEWASTNSAIVAAAKSPRPQEIAEIDVDVETLWDSPEALQQAGFYAWLAGESAAIKTIRRLLVTQNGIDRKRVAFMGYWRLGQSEKQG
ncbi:siderophore-interacting protein [Leifsonia sp. A12D58]|uniref:siderophore-interacting protein n=1 Tax=Leifsonia sp. A12D58 TaxID=3397674 RepID=UPI0039E1F19A